MAGKTGKQPDATLGEYRGKRNLARSGEPAGGRRHGRRCPRFVVQEHQARTLHCDFRLEEEGTLKSWAMPKGPAADPAQKRRGGHSGRGVRDGRELSVAEAIDYGHVSVDLHGKKLRGGYSLTRMRRGNRQAWLLVKKTDEFAGGDQLGNGS